jgi:hypothetical protein
VPAFGSIKRSDLIRNLRKLGFEGPYTGGKHQYMVRGEVIPIARAEFTIAPLLKVPPASRGEPRGARGFGSPCLQGEP